MPPRFLTLSCCSALVWLLATPPAVAAVDLKPGPTATLPHWAFQPVVRHDPPRVGRRSVIRNPIDQFILARLSSSNLAPSPETDRATLIRRVSLDLTGLPPSVAEVDAFLADRSRNAYERVVERLLASPHYGERWGRWWLDAARYADSNGFEKDRTRSIWPWRDWVIAAFNADRPFDRFTVEQLAGDLLPGAGLDERIATGFLRNSTVNMEGGIEPEKFRVEAIIDRVDCVSRTWLGITLACAQCHNHKYDPFTQREYYQFYAFLNGDDEPKLDVPTPAQRGRRAEIIGKAQALEDRWRADPRVAARFAAWRAGLGTVRGDWQVLEPKEWHSEPMKFEKQEDFSLLAGGDIWNNSVLRIWIDVARTNITGFRIEALNDGNLPFNGPGLEGDGSFNLCEFTVDATPLRELASPDAGSTGFIATTNRIVFNQAVADQWAAGGHPTNAIDGVTDRDGWHVGFTKGRRNEERRLVVGAAQPFGFPGGTRLLISLWQKPKESKLSNHAFGRVRLSLTTATGPLEADPLSGDQRKLMELAGNDAPAPWLFHVFFFQDPGLADAAREWDALWSDWPTAEHTTLVLSQRPVPRRTRIFKRGDWTRPTEAVTPGVPAALPPLGPGATLDRLGLARWIVNRGNPLTPRVLVNRIWQAYFGQGFVPTPEDFGTRAELPSHPALLDWLASELMAPQIPATSAERVGRGGASTLTPWSVKHLHRLIVMSAVYRQSSHVTPKLLEVDPANRLLARGPRVRFDAEMVQDLALKASGLLSEKIGGPSVFPPLPEGVMQLAYGPIPWNVSRGDDRYRRAMYTFWKRSAPYPVLTTFDAPSGDQSCVRRNRSNTPLQALVTLNEPSLNHAARWLGWRALSQGGATDEARIQFAFRQVLSRVADPTESSALLRLLKDLRAGFREREKDAQAFAYADPENPPPLPPGSGAVDAAAWAGVARAIFNLDETITKE